MNSLPPASFDPRFTAIFAAAFLVALAIPTLANPLAVDGARRPIRMIAEDVTISVGPEVSLVKGSYRFQQLPDDWPVEKDTHVLIYVPVFLRQNKESAVPDPVVKVGGKSIRSRTWNDLKLGDDPSGDFSDAPKGFVLEVHQYAVPLALVKRDFTISVEYLQPSFPGQIAAYLPIRPPTQAGAARITFVAESGYALKPFGAHYPWSPASSSLAFAAEDGKLLRVKCVKVRR